MDKRLWLGLHFANLSDVESLTRLIVDFTLAPSRAAEGLAAPRPNEGNSFNFHDLGMIEGVPAHGDDPAPP